MKIRFLFSLLKNDRTLPTMNRALPIRKSVSDRSGENRGVRGPDRQEKSLRRSSRKKDAAVSIE
jgi:hypothetical protein